MKRILLIIAAVLGFTFIAAAQNSVPAPGSGSITMPAGGPGGGFGGFAPPAYAPPTVWGSPWGWNSYGYNYEPTVVISPTYQTSGKVNVVAVGYDDDGVWRSIPMSVGYNDNGAQYSATVLTAWNPWTDSWNTGLNIPAMNTSYRLNGKNYHFYAVLSTGTYYFNL